MLDHISQYLQASFFQLCGFDWIIQNVEERVNDTLESGDPSIWLRVLLT